MLNPVGNSVHYGDSLLILRLKTNLPAQFHRNIIKGIHVAMKMSLLAEDLTKDEKDALIGLNDMLTQLIPSESHLEKVYLSKEIIQSNS